MGEYLYNAVRIKRSVGRACFAVYLRRVAASVGQNPEIDPVWIDAPSRLSIGDNVQIRRGAVLNARSEHVIGIELGDGVHIKEGAYIDAYGGFVKLGEGVRIGHHAIVAGHGGVEFGSWSGVSGLSYVIAANHTFQDPSRPFVDQDETTKGIKIGRNVWGGAGVVITDGVHVGDHAVIGAGSVVRRDVEPFSVVMGNPARVAYRFDESANRGE